MKSLLRPVAIGLFHLGGVGLLILGILDSSFLVMPLGNDLLLVALSASTHARMPYYAVMAATGSVLGCLLIDLMVRKEGEAGLEKYIARRRLEYIKRKIDKGAGWAVAFASVMPPPFPFTPFIVGAAAFQYPRRKLLAIVAVTRLFRFTAEGLLAIFFGRRILSLAKSPVFEYAVIALIVIAVGGSALSLYRWIKSSRTPAARAAGS